MFIAVRNANRAGGGKRVGILAPTRRRRKKKKSPVAHPVASPTLGSIPT